MGDLNPKDDSMASGRLCVPKRSIVSRLRDEGFELERQTGSHQQWKNYRLKRTVTVPDKRELKGNQVRTIYNQAGWDWKDSLINDLPKARLEGLPVANECVPAPKPKPVSSQPEVFVKPPVQEATEELEPETIPVTEGPTNQEEDEMARRATAPPAKTKIPRRIRTQDEVELMAQDMMENPGDTLTAVAKRWDSGQSYMTPIAQGVHAKLSDRTKLMIHIMQGRVPVLGSKAKSLLAEYMADPKAMPEGVRRRFEVAVPKYAKNPAEPLSLAPPKQPDPVPPPEPEPEPQPEAEIEHTPAAAAKPEVEQQPEHLPVPEQRRKPEQMSLIRAEGVMYSYAPVQVGQASVQVGKASASLKEILEAARRVMRNMGITKVTLPEFGDIVIERKEILV